MALKVQTENSSEGWADEEADLVAEINITPLTDVFLVLLIIFMVTSSALSQMGVSVNLPSSSREGSVAHPEGVIVTLFPDSSIEINGEKVVPRTDAWSGFEDKLKGEFEKTPSRVVILEADREALLGSAIEVMDHARRAGARDFAVATKTGTDSAD